MAVIRSTERAVYIYGHRLQEMEGTQFSPGTTCVMMAIGRKAMMDGGALPL